MSDLEYEAEYLDESLIDDVDDVDETDLELIRIVKNNPGLWDKSSKTYSNNTEKDIMWDSIASRLPIAMTGATAAKRFRTLRTTFSRHLKKVRLSQPRSGAGSDWPVYQPTWPLYNEMLFLTNSIKPRQTKSNTKVSILKPKADRNSKRATVVRGTKQPQQAITINNNDDDPNIDDPKYRSDYSNSTEGDTSNAESCASTSGRTVTKTRAHQTPPPDNFYKKKMKHDNMEHLDKLAGSLFTLSQQMMSMPTPKQEEKENLDSEVEGLLLVVKTSLQQTPTQDRIPCLIEILHILQRFKNKS